MRTIQIHRFLQQCSLYRSALITARNIQDPKKKVMRVATECMNHDAVAPIGDYLVQNWSRECNVNRFLGFAPLSALWRGYT